MEENTDENVANVRFVPDGIRDVDQGYRFAKVLIKAQDSFSKTLVKSNT